MLKSLHRLAPLCLAATAIAAYAQPASAPSTKPNRYGFTVCPETTILTAPLFPDGTVDYAGACNQAMGNGVTPENNAFVVLLKATGTSERVLGHRHAEILDLVSGHEERGCIRPFYASAPAASAPATDSRPSEDPVARLSKAQSEPWKSGAYPDVETWLSANEQALSIAGQAAECPRFWAPHLSSEAGIDLLSGIPFVRYRQLLLALRARAMRSLGNGQPDKAWQDVRTVHRLAHLLAQGDTLLAGLVAADWQRSAFESDVAILRSPNLDRKTLDAMLADLRSAKALPTLMTLWNRLEVYSIHDHIQVVARAENEEWAKHLDVKTEEIDKALAKLQLPRLDYDRVLRRVTAFTKETMVDHEWKSVEERQAAHAIDDWGGRITKLRANSQMFEDQPDGSEPKFNVWPKAGESREAYSNRFADGFIAFMAPSLGRADELLAQSQKTQDLAAVACALEVYRADNGHYPAALAALAPKYLPAVPPDFYGNPLSYAPSTSGFRLVSLGINGIPNSETKRGRKDDILVEISR